MEKEGSLSMEIEGTPIKGEIGGNSSSLSLKERKEKGKEKEELGSARVC